MLNPQYLPASLGGLYVSLYRPEEERPFRGWILHIPAFAEEMNKSRAMVSRQARRLAALGYCVVVADLYGAGDSPGELKEANLQRWRQDIANLLQWIGAQGAQGVHLWGLRLGCLLALEAACEWSGQVQSILLWQPVNSGNQFMTQFLRLRLAAGLQSGTVEKVADLRRMLEQGDPLEVAGYDLNRDLVAQLGQLSMASFNPPPDIPITWIEVATQDEGPLLPASRKVLEGWVEEGVSVTSLKVQGDPFWTTQELAFSPALLQATDQYYDSRPLGVEAAAKVPEVPVELARGPEQPLVFDCDGDELVGVLHHGNENASTAVLLVVGGPQYRVGSHRQFVYLARDLSGAGIPVLRFDYRGMGDSAGELVGFEGIGRDIRCAMDALSDAVPGLSRVVIWGLCDAASAAAFYAATDTRVGGLVLLNPWVRSTAGEARALLRHYYARRVFSGEFWRKIIRGDLQVLGSLQSLLSNLGNSLKSPGKVPAKVDAVERSDKQEVPATGNSANLVEELYRGLAAFKAPCLFILSGNDLTAAEFIDSASAHKKMGKLLRDTRMTHRDLPEADHTFSRRVWRDQVAHWTIDWIKAL